MLNFLLRLLDRHFKVDLNLVTEEDVLGLLKLIGYSYSFSKNFFAAIGAPNNWTQCLHILNWLVELVKYFEEVIFFFYSDKIILAKKKKISKGASRKN